MKEVPQVKLAKVYLKTVTLEEFTSVIVENHQTSKISHMIEFRTETFYIKS